MSTRAHRFATGSNWIPLGLGNAQRVAWEEDTGGRRERRKSRSRSPKAAAGRVNGLNARPREILRGTRAATLPAWLTKAAEVNSCVPGLVVSDRQTRVAESPVPSAFAATPSDIPGEPAISPLLNQHVGVVDRPLYGPAADLAVQLPSPDVAADMQISSDSEISTTDAGSCDTHRESDASSQPLKCIVGLAAGQTSLPAVQSPFPEPAEQPPPAPAARTLPRSRLARASEALQRRLIMQTARRKSERERMLLLQRSEASSPRETPATTHTPPAQCEPQQAQPQVNWAAGNHSTCICAMVAQQGIIAAAHCAAQASLIAGLAHARTAMPLPAPPVIINVVVAQTSTDPPATAAAPSTTLGDVPDVEMRTTGVDPVPTESPADSVAAAPLPAPCAMEVDWAESRYSPPQPTRHMPPAATLQSKTPSASNPEAGLEFLQEQTETPKASRPVPPQLVALLPPTARIDGSDTDGEASLWSRRHGEGCWTCSAFRVATPRQYELVRSAATVGVSSLSPARGADNTGLQGAGPAAQHTPGRLAETPNDFSDLLEGLSDGGSLSEAEDDAQETAYRFSFSSCLTVPIDELAALAHRVSTGASVPRRVTIELDGDVEEEARLTASIERSTAAAVAAAIHASLLVASASGARHDKETASAAAVEAKQMLHEEEAVADAAVQANRARCEVEAGDAAIVEAQRVLEAAATESAHEDVARRAEELEAEQIAEALAEMATRGQTACVAAAVETELVRREEEAVAAAAIEAERERCEEEAAAAAAEAERVCREEEAVAAAAEAERVRREEEAAAAVVIEAERVRCEEEAAAAAVEAERVRCEEEAAAAAAEAERVCREEEAVAAAAEAERVRREEEAVAAAAEAERVRREEEAAAAVAIEAERVRCEEEAVAAAVEAERVRYEEEAAAAAAAEAERVCREEEAVAAAAEAERVRREEEAVAAAAADAERVCREEEDERTWLAESLRGMMEPRRQDADAEQARKDYDAAWAVAVAAEAEEAKAAAAALAFDAALAAALAVTLAADDCPRAPRSVDPECAEDTEWTQVGQPQARRTKHRHDASVSRQSPVPQRLRVSNAAARDVDATVDDVDLANIAPPRSLRQMLQQTAPVPPQQKPFQVQIIGLSTGTNGPTTLLWVHPSDTLAAVLNNFNAKTRIKALRFEYQGRPVDLRRTVAQLGLQPLSKLHAHFRLQGGMQADTQAAMSDGGDAGVDDGRGAGLGQAQQAYTSPDHLAASTVSAACSCGVEGRRACTGCVRQRYCAEGCQSEDYQQHNALCRSVRQQRPPGVGELSQQQQQARAGAPAAQAREPQRMPGLVQLSRWSYADRPQQVASPTAPRPIVRQAQTLPNL